jgi:hypothetical protein
MSNDLIERLRNKDEYPDYAWLDEAADLIESQRKRIAQLENLLYKEHKRGDKGFTYRLELEARIAELETAIEKSSKQIGPVDCTMDAWLTLDAALKDNPNE